MYDTSLAERSSFQNKRTVRMYHNIILGNHKQLGRPLPATPANFRLHIGMHSKIRTDCCLPWLTRRLLPGDGGVLNCFRIPLVWGDSMGASLACPPPSADFPPAALSCLQKTSAYIRPRWTTHWETWWPSKRRPDTTSYVHISHGRPGRCFFLT